MTSANVCGSSTFEFIFLGSPLLASSFESVSMAFPGTNNPFWLSGLKEISQSDAKAALAAAFFDSFLEGPEEVENNLILKYSQNPLRCLSLTSTLKLTSVHCDHRLELGVLGAYRLRAAEADVGEQLVK